MNANRRPASCDARRRSTRSRRFVLWKRYAQRIASVGVDGRRFGGFRFVGLQLPLGVRHAAEV